MVTTTLLSARVLQNLEILLSWIPQLSHPLTRFVPLQGLLSVTTATVKFLHFSFIFAQHNPHCTCTNKSDFGDFEETEGHRTASN